jgi:hypothetical protein
MEQQSGGERFVQIAEFAQLMRSPCQSVLRVGSPMHVELQRR